MTRLHPDIERALEETGLPWAIEAGGKHYKLRLDGRMILTLSRGARRRSGSPCMNRNAVAHIRRVARELKGQP